MGLTGAAAVGAGLNGGVFFAFSTFVMPGLRRAPVEVGIRSMQSINRAAVTVPFMTALFGTAVLCVVVAVTALRSGRSPTTTWSVAGAVAYLAAAVVVTAAANVPRNNALERLDIDAAAGWAAYLDGWTAWNHVRTVGCLVAAVCLTIAVTNGRTV